MSVVRNQPVWFIEKVPLCIYPPALRPEANTEGPYRLERREARVLVVEGDIANLEIKFSPLPGRPEALTIERRYVPRGEGANCWMERDA